MKFTYFKTPLNKYTFKSKKIKNWVETRSFGKVLNLFAGKIKLDIDETRNDVDKTMNSKYHLDALEFIKTWKGNNFDTIICDPPYALRKSIEMYNGNYTSKFKLIADNIPLILNKNGIVISYGYHSVFMGKKRGFELEEICLMGHGGAQHDTIAIIERKTNEI